jgi:CspA family cold shock protein
MVFRDQSLVCDECGKSFFFTVTEQRRLAQQVGEENVETPRLCHTCRGHEASPPRASSEQVARSEPVERVERATPSARVERIEPVERVQEQVDRESKPAATEVDDFPFEEEGIELKLIGEVKWFNRNKGYGFVTMADGEEVFFHRSDVVGAQLSQIRDGVQIEFQVRRTEKGLEAFNVSLLPTA